MKPPKKAGPYGLQMFFRCIGCKKYLMRRDPRTHELKRAVSRYPYCVPCFGVRARDPEFKQFVNRKVHAA